MHQQSPQSPAPARKIDAPRGSAASLPAPTTPSTGIILILLTLIGWTSIPLFLKHFVSLIDPWSANGWRYGFSALLWLPVIVFAMSRRTLSPDVWRAALLPSLFNTIAQVCFGLAPYYIDPGLMTFSLRLQVVFLMFGAAAMFPAERRVIRSPVFLAGITLLLAGTLLTLWCKPGGLGDVKSASGVALAITAGIFYALYSLAVRKQMHHIPPLPAFAVVSQYTGVVLVLLMLLLGKGHGAAVIHDLSREQFGLLLLSAIIGIGLGHTMYYASIQRLGLAVASGVVQLQPVTVSIGSMILFKENLTALQWVTGTAAICGAVLMLAAQQRTVRAQPARSLSGPTRSTEI